MALSKNYHNSDGSRSDRNVSPVVLSKKIKMKTRNTIASSYHLKFSSTQDRGVLFFSCWGHGV